MSEPALFGIDDAPPARRRTRREILAEALLAIPNLVKLLVRLFRDPRIPRRRKLLVGAAGLYLVSPIDLIPEALLPVVGQLDDVVLLVFSIDYLLRGADRDVIAEYWDGSEDVLDLVSALLEWGAELMPRPIRKMVSR